MPQVLVVEDNVELAFGLKSHLELEGYEVRHAADGPSAVSAALEDVDDVIVLDLMLPSFDGYHVLRTIRERRIETPVLVLTARAAEDDKLRAFRMGADDYLTKPFGAMELLARVNALLRRPHLASRGTAASLELEPVERFGTIEVHPFARLLFRDGEAVATTPKEFDLLLALMRRRGKVATRSDLLREVWRYGEGVTSRTVDIHVAMLRRKLEEDSAQPRHILTAYKVGYRLDTLDRRPAESGGNTDPADPAGRYPGDKPRGS